MIVGQAGTGKSTALTGVARAHQEAGRRVVVTSTGAQAAERLTAEFSEAGLSDAAGYSIMALQAAVRRGAVTLGPEVTVIHDEAALASTREQAWLLQAAAESGARIIEVGDPRQSGAVGAGGLWPEIEKAAGERGGWCSSPGSSAPKTRRIVAIRPNGVPVNTTRPSPVFRAAAAS